jgi:hypothetical protein
MNNLEQAIRQNYLEILQPSDETVETVKAVASGVADVVKESYDEYGQARAKAQQAGTEGEFALKSAGAIAKGAVQGVGGVVGDLEKLLGGIVAAAKTPEGQSKLKSFGKALQDETFFTNSEDMARHLEKLGIISPEGTGFVEGAGELFAPIGTAIKGVSKAGKIASKIKGK